MLHRVILTAASVVALATAANAADMYRPAEGGYKDVPYVGVNWSGLYVGVNGGYGFDSSNIGSTIGGAYNISPEGAFGGGQIGYNVQRGNFVFGVEADIQGGDIKDSKTVSVTNGGVSASLGINSSLDYFGTVRARAGYAFDRTLVYATGGLAYGQITDGIDAGLAVAGVGSASVSLKKSTDATGYVVGGGVEHKFAPNWSGKVEYQYIDLGQDSVWAKATAQDFAVSTVRAGLNYHIGTSFEPLK